MVDTNELKAGDKVIVIGNTFYEHLCAGSEDDVALKATNKMIGTTCEIKGAFLDSDGTIQVWNENKSDWWFFYPKDLAWPSEAAPNRTKPSPKDKPQSEVEAW